MLLEAINITPELKICKADAPELGKAQMSRAAVMDLLAVCESHAMELKKVYNDAVFGTAHLAAGKYFAERVKSGGIWDYKAFLGLKTRYTIPDFATMTGETIGKLILMTHVTKKIFNGG